MVWYYNKRVNRPNITLDFVLKDSIEYYSLGSADLLPGSYISWWFT
jgi:hypothetical protein